MIFIFLLEHALVVGNANKDNLRDVDLHEDEELVKGAENVADARHVDPLVTVQAEQVLSVALNLLPIDDKVASSYSQNGADSEEDVGPEQESSLRLEELHVVIELVRADWRKLVLVNHVLVQGQVDIVDLVEQDHANKSNEVRWVDVCVAFIDEEC